MRTGKKSKFNSKGFFLKSKEVTSQDVFQINSRPQTLGLHSEMPSKWLFKLGRGRTDMNSASVYHTRVALLNCNRAQRSFKALAYLRLINWFSARQRATVDTDTWAAWGTHTTYFLHQLFRQSGWSKTFRNPFLETIGLGKISSASASSCNERHMVYNVRIPV